MIFSQKIVGAVLLSAFIAQVSAAESLLPPPTGAMDAAFIKELGKPEKKDERKQRVEQFRRESSSTLPYTKEEVAKLRQTNDEVEKATNSRPAPKSAGDKEVSWSPGDGAPVIRMAEGFGSVILFYHPDGTPWMVAPNGAFAGDKASINPIVTDNSVYLEVVNPWRSTNLTVYLRGFQVPFQATLESTRNPSDTAVDYQYRVRVMSGVAQTIEKSDRQNMSSLLRMVNGLGMGEGFTGLRVAGVERSSSGGPGTWTPTLRQAGIFHFGQDGLTYAVLTPGLHMLTPHLASMNGADGSKGYVLGGNNPRVFTAQDTDGVFYKITLQR